MTEPSEKYKGPIPKPSAEQIANKDVAGFEAEELSDAKYKEAGLPATVAEILANPERYEAVLADGEFSKLTAATEAPPPEATEPKEATSAIAVAPVTPAEEDLPDMSPPEPATSMPTPVKMHEPKMKFNVLDITARVETTMVCGMMRLTKHGLEEAVESPFPEDKGWGQAFRKLLLPYQTGGTINPLQATSEGYVDPKNHSYVVGTDVAPVAGASHAHFLADRRVYSHTMDPNDVGVLDQVRRLVIDPSMLMDFTPDPTNGAEEEDSDQAKCILDLATFPRAVGTNVMVHDIIASPLRLRLLIHSLQLYRALHYPFDEWIRLHVQAGLLNQNRVPFIKEERLQVERERISWNEHHQSMFMMTFFGTPGKTTEHFYYGGLINEPLSTCEGALQRSFTKASAQVLHIQSREREAMSYGGPNNVKEWVAKLSAISSTDAAEGMRLLTAGLVGGYRSAFTIRSAPESMHAITASLCALANIAYMDMSLVTTQSFTHQLQVLLSPFVSETDQLTHRAEPAVNRKSSGVVGPEIIPGVHTLVAQYMAAREVNPNAPFVFKDVPSKFFSPTSMGGKVGKNLPGIISEVVNDALRRVFTPQQVSGRVFNAPGNDTVLHPFTPRSDAYDMIVRGEPAANEPPMYNTMAHNREAETLNAIVIRWTQVLATLSTFAAGIDGAATILIRDRPHVRSGMAVVSAAIVSASMERECLPLKAGFRTTQMNTNLNIIDNRAREIELPFTAWLSFAMYGVKSSQFVQEGSYIQYVDLTNTAMPSMYPFQLGMERCVVHEQIMALRALGRDDEIIRPDAVLELITLILGRFWVSPDPDSRSRITALLEIAVLRISLPGFPNTPLGQPPPLTLPAIFKASELVASRRAGTLRNQHRGTVGEYIPKTTLGAAMAKLYEPQGPPVEYEPVALGSYLALDDMKKCRVKEFFITKTPIVPIKVFLVDGSTTFVYTGDVPRAAVIEVEDLIRHRYNGETTWTEEALRAKADLYVADGRVSSWKYIRIGDVLTTFKMIEDKGTGDTIKTGEMRLTIKMDKERQRADKYSVTELPVYTHMVGDLTQLRGKTADEEAKIMRTLFRYILVPWQTIRRTLVHFDGVDVDSYGLYTNDNRGKGVPLEQNELSQIRLRDGYHGITIAGRCHLTTRGVENFTIMEKLVKRVLPGTM